MHIKKLAKAGKIVAITQDFCEDQIFQELTNVIQKQGYLVDTLYLSNLYAYLPLNGFHKTFEILNQSSPIVIHCTPPTSCRCPSGCQCSKEQHIGKFWERVSKKQGAIKPLNVT